MSEADPVISGNGSRLLALLREALAIADELEWHFVAAMIDHALGMCPIDDATGDD